MEVGIIVLIVLIGMTLFQVIVQAYHRRKEHREVLERLERLEANLKARE